MHRYIILFFITLLSTVNVFAQSGTLKGQVTDAMTGETIPMANVVVLSDGVTVVGGSSDFDGNFTIKPINPGTYTVEVSFIGYSTILQNNVLISPNKITFTDYELKVNSS